MLTINYDPRSTPDSPWLLIGQVEIYRHPTLAISIANLMRIQSDQEYIVALYNFMDGSWGVSTMSEVEHTELTQFDTLIGTYPRTELPYILQIYGQMLPCKYRS